MDKLTEYAAELQSLAQAGLFYGKDVYDRERYTRIRDIAAEIMAMKTELPLDAVKELFCSDYGYQTPKVDTRAAIFRDNKILLVHEKNGTWSLPGGWCEFNMSPAENAVKEAREEAGKNVKVKSVSGAKQRYAQQAAVCLRRCENLLSLRGSWRRVPRKFRNHRGAVFCSRLPAAFSRRKMQRGTDINVFPCNVLGKLGNAVRLNSAKSTLHGFI